MDRRGFLKLLGASGTGVAIGAVGGLYIPGLPEVAIPETPKNPELYYPYPILLEIEKDQSWDTLMALLDYTLETRTNLPEYDWGGPTFRARSMASTHTATFTGIVPHEVGPKVMLSIASKACVNLRIVREDGWASYITGRVINMTIQSMCVSGSNDGSELEVNMILESAPTIQLVDIKPEGRNS